jgi:hypothetical protein
MAWAVPDNVDGGRSSDTFSAFLVAVLQLVSTDPIVVFFFCFFLADAFGAPGEVDTLRSEPP